jgi:hypothetical protein
MSSLLHGVILIIPNDPRGPWAPIRKHGVGQDDDIDLVAGQAVLHVELPMVLRNLRAIDSLHKGVPQQHGEAVTVQAHRAQPTILKGPVQIV